jgi:hypothetical protein
LGPIDVSGQPNFEKTNFVYLYNTYYAKSLLRKHCKKGGNCCNPFLGPFTKNNKIQKKIKKILSKNNSSEKRMPERPKNGQKLVEEVQNYKD